MSTEIIHFSKSSVVKTSYGDYYESTTGEIGETGDWFTSRAHVESNKTWKDTWENAKLYLTLKISGSYSDGNVTGEIKYLTKNIETSNAKQKYNELAAESVALKTFETTSGKTTSIYIPITEEEIIKNIILNGLAVLGNSRQQTASITSVSANIEYIDENADPVVNWIPENMTGGKFKDITVSNHFEQYINKPMVLAWEYKQEAGVGVAETEIKIRIKTKTSDEEYKIKDVSYLDNIGSCVVPENIWKKIPCGMNITLTVVSKTGKSNETIMTAQVPYQSAEAIYPAKDTGVKYENGTTIKWEPKDVSGFYTYPEISGYKVFFSTNGGATYDAVAEITGDVREYELAGYTLPIGVIYWRVQVLYDNNTIQQNVSYAESRFIVKADPGTTTVTCNGKPIPTVQWQSVAQTAYQVRFGEYDSGAVYSGDTQHKVPYIFADGVYEVSVRTQINTGEWSEWTEPIYVQITNVPLGAGITAAASVDGYRVRITWTKKTAYQDYIVYRNGTPIHVTDGGSATEGGYMDKTANGVTVYTVRGVASSGYYDETEPVTVDAAAKTDVLVIIGTDEIIPLRYTQSFPKKHGYVADMPVTYRYFAGREKPIAIMSGQIERTIPLSYADKGRELARKITKCLGKTVMFKDTGGDTITGILGQVEASMGRVSVTTFQITEVDYNEQVEYIPRE